MFWKSGFRSGAKSLGIFFFGGFWILAVWMPRKYSTNSRLKLMYRSVHSEDFGSGMCNFFGNRVLDMVLN